jgi:hypothetical protein
MAILKVGDWVLAEGDGLGQIIVLDFNPKYHLVQLVNSKRKFAVLLSETILTKVDLRSLNY